jgi:Protein of unknown function (DUF3107)
MGATGGRGVARMVPAGRYDVTPGAEELRHMEARIGVADSSKVIEVEVEDVESFRRDLEEMFSSSREVYWFTDVKQRAVGIPVGRIAYVEIDSEETARKVGFAPGT